MIPATAPAAQAALDVISVGTDDLNAAPSSVEQPAIEWLLASQRLSRLANQRMEPSRSWSDGNAILWPELEGNLWDDILCQRAGFGSRCRTDLDVVQIRLGRRSQGGLGHLVTVRDLGPVASRRNGNLVAGAELGVAGREAHGIKLATKSGSALAWRSAVMSRATSARIGRPRTCCRPCARRSACYCRAALAISKEVGPVLTSRHEWIFYDRPRRSDRR